MSESSSILKGVQFASEEDRRFYEENFNDYESEVSSSFGDEDEVLEVEAEEIPKPISTIPLANDPYGRSPADLEMEKKVQEAQIQQELQKQAEPQPKPPTKAQFNAEVVSQIASQNAAEARAKVKKNLVSPAAVEKANQQFTKMATQLNNAKDPSDLGYIAYKLNQYKLKYEKKIVWKFRPQGYNANSPHLVEECEAVETLLNVTDIPNAIKTAAQELTGVLVDFLQKVAPPQYKDLFNGIPELVQTQHNLGYFDDEYEQLAIKWSFWFSQGPEVRAGFKHLWLWIQMMRVNRNAMKMPKVSHSTLRRANGL
jgi:hypothetical protein